MSKLPISEIQLVSTYLSRLTPDPHTGSTPNEFRDNLKVRPSLQRRARIIPHNAHFSYVSPLPLSFPYQIPLSDDIQDKSQYIEKWLSEREPTNLVGSQKWISPSRHNDRSILLAVSQSTADEYLPGVDLDAVDDFVDVMSGRAMLSTDSFAPYSTRYSGKQFGQWAGQLGDGRAITVLSTQAAEVQLKGAGRTPFSRSADGLAVLRSSIREFLCAEYAHALGIPSSRSLSIVSLPDLLVQREREETGSVVSRVVPIGGFIRIGSFEAFHPVQEMMFFGGGQQPANPDALLSLTKYVHQSVFQLPPSSTMAKDVILESARRNAKMVAGWQAYGFMHGVINTDNVSILGLTIDYGPYKWMDVWDEWCICNHTDGEGRYSYRNQPSMIVFALRSLLDALGPLVAVEDSAQQDGKSLTDGWANLPSPKDDSQTDADRTKAQKAHWAVLKSKGVSLLSDELDKQVQSIMSEEYARLMRQRLSLRNLSADDSPKLFRPLLSLLGEYQMDFPRALRLLVRFQPETLEKEAEMDRLLNALLQTSTKSGLDRQQALKEWRDWFKTYAQRIHEDVASGAWGTAEDAARARRENGENHNPRFVLRQWLLEEIIAKAEIGVGDRASEIITQEREGKAFDPEAPAAATLPLEDGPSLADDGDSAGKGAAQQIKSADLEEAERLIAKALEMAQNPFKKWGREDEEFQGGEIAALSAVEEEERQLCGIGKREMLGFQCSCSS